jgi:hypothetical protein
MKKASLLFTVIISVFVFNAGFSQNNKLLLISEKGIEKTSSDKSDLWFFDNTAAVQRYAEVALSQEILTYAYDQKNSNTLSLNLFDDTNYEAVIDRTNVNVNGSHTVRVRINDSDYSYMLLSTTANRSLGIINIPAKDIQYKIISCPETNIHYLLEMKISDLDYIEGTDDVMYPIIDDRTIEEQLRIKNEISAKNLMTNEYANVDVQVVYTTAAKTWGDANGGGIDNIVNLAMEKAHLSLDNSKTFMTMRLVHSAEVYYTESGSSSNDLTILTEGSGALQVVHEWRNEYGADLTAMFTFVTDTGGIAWLLNNSNGNPNIAFSITRIQQAATSLTHPHEMGHNMGCHHHKAQNFQPGPGLFSYSAGWRWTGTDNVNYCDLMTYSGGSYFADGVSHTNVAYFSNPNISHVNVPTGDAINGDNARTLREIRHVISAYRPAIVNSVEGLVTDIEDNPLQGVQIRVAGTNITTFSGVDGTFTFPALNSGGHTLIASLEGYTTANQTITVFPNTTTYVTFKLSLLSMISLNGFVFAESDNELPIQDAMIVLNGDSYFETKTDEFGEYLFDDVFGNSQYKLEVFKPGYDFHIEILNTENESFTKDNILLNEALYIVDNLSCALVSNGTKISWEEPSGKKVFRLDDGVPVSKAGFSGGTLNAVLGSAHNHRGYIEAVSWMLTGANHSEVKVWVFGMNDLGYPDTKNILYQHENVPNNHLSWTTHVFPEPVYAANGFFLGLSTIGNLGLAIDSGVDELFEFRDGTNFYNSDISLYDFRDMNTYIPGNFLIRAWAYDLGSLIEDKKATSYFLDEDNYFATVLKSIELPAELLGYNVYLNNMETPVAELIESTEYVFPNLGSGIFTVGVQAVYELGVSDIVTVTFPPYTSLNEIEEQIVAIYPNPARDVINVSANTNIKEISVFNILGNLIYRIELNEEKAQLPLNDYISGFYFINVTTETGQTTHKIVITK